MNNLMISAILSILLAFGVDVPTVNNVRAILTATEATTTPIATVQTVVTPVVENTTVYFGSTVSTTTPVDTTPVVNTPVVQSPVMNTPNWTIKVITENALGKRDVPATTKAITGKLKLWVEVYNKDGEFVKKPVTVTTNDPDLPSSFVINAPNEGDFFCVAPNPTGQNGCPVENPVSVGTFDFTFTVEDVSKTIQVTVTE